MEDYIILVDKNKKILGIAPKLSSHNFNTPLHLAFSVFLFNPKGELLLQQRSSKKKTWPLVWSNSCCGHQKLDEDIYRTAESRIFFELGMVVSDLEIMLPNFRYRCMMNGIVENEICPVFVGITDQQPIIDRDEVQAFQWIEWGKWLAQIRKRPYFYSYWSIKETKELLKNKKFQAFLQRAIK